LPKAILTDIRLIPFAPRRPGLERCHHLENLFMGGGTFFEFSGRHCATTIRRVMAQIERFLMIDCSINIVNVPLGGCSGPDFAGVSRRSR
jgi:hypothetical protein